MVFSGVGSAVNLKRRDLVQIFFRSFLIQGLWTTQRAQNLGYLYSLWPAFRRLFPRREDRAVVVRTHAGFFSTHPYTGSLLLGVVAGMEESRSQGKEGLSPEIILSARSAMSGPLAALGEGFFWGTWLPFCLAVALVAGCVQPSCLVRSPILFLVMFNVPHLAVRATGLWLGYRWKTGVVPRLASIRIHSLLPLVAAVGMGLVLLRGIWAPLTGFSVAQSLMWVGFFWGTLKLGVRPSVLAVGVAGSAVAYSWAKVLI